MMISTRRSFIAALVSIAAAPLALALDPRAGGSIVGPRDVVPDSPAPPINPPDPSDPPGQDDDRAALDHDGGSSSAPVSRRMRHRRPRRGRGRPSGGHR